MKRLLLVLLCLVPPGLRAANAIDHTLFSALLHDHVVAGRVDYAALKTDSRLADYLAQYAVVDPAALPDEAARLAYWINAYNAFTLKLVADAYPVKSIHELGIGGRIIGFLIKRTPWDIRFANIAGRKMTLNEIEHEVIRKQFDEPRIHFAIVCAAVSCPPLRSEAYFPERLDAQLEEQTRLFLRDGVNNRFDLANRKARLSPIFSWFKEDFGGTDLAVIEFTASFAPPEVSADLEGRPADWTLAFSDYDWSLND